MAPVADPWDAPYFGAPIYLTYQPTLSATPAGRPANSPSAPATLLGAPHSDALTPTPRSDTRTAAPRWDPWDAPYFGAPVYLAYQPTPLPEPAEGAAQPTAQIDAASALLIRESERPLVAVGAATTPLTPAQPVGETRRPDIGAGWRQTWFGRLFGADRRN